MKKIFGITMLSLASLVSAQVTIEKTTPSPAPVDSASLELGNATGGAKGIVLPYITDASAITASVGTLVFDTTDQKVKVATATTAPGNVDTTTVTWKDLSVDAEKLATPVPASSLAENAKAKVIIGQTGTAAANVNGVLILSDTDKAMVLPRVANTSAIKNPSAGMMVYLTDSDLLAVFNGKQWSFWAANP